MLSFPVKMWCAIVVTGLFLLAMGAAAQKKNWAWVTLLSGLLIAGLFMVTTEMLWWMAG